MLKRNLILDKSDLLHKNIFLNKTSVEEKQKMKSKSKLFILIFYIIFIGSVCSFCPNKKFDTDEWYIWTNDNVQLYIKEFGKGDTVVVVHGGWGAEHSYLLDAVNGLENNYHFVFYDQRGSLRSPCPDSLISVEKHIEDLEKIRQELGLKKMTLLGHSMGTYLILSYLKKYPKNVKGIILLASILLKYPVNKSDSLLYLEVQNEAISFMKRPEIEAEIKKSGLDKDNKTDKDKTYAWKIRFAGANIYNVKYWRKFKGGGAFYNKEAGLAAAKSMPSDGFDFISILRKHTYPISIILGDYDYLDMGGKVHKKQISYIPNIELIIIKNAGHVAWIDQPKEFNKIMKKALKKYKN